MSEPTADPSDMLRYWQRPWGWRQLEMTDPDAIGFEHVTAVRYGDKVNGRLGRTIVPGAPAVDLDEDALGEEIT